MYIHGYVFITKITGENITAPSNIDVYGKIGTQTVSSTKTNATGYYVLEINVTAYEGQTVELYVEDIGPLTSKTVTSGQVQQNLTVIDTEPPTAPTNLVHTSAANDTTPSFNWTASIDNLAIEGYYVNISDVYPTTWIDNVTAWECPIGLEDGNYTIYVWARDLAGNNGTAASLEFTIETIKPIADFYAEPTSGNEPLTVQFYDNSVNFQTITSWFWDFGDGTNSTEQNPVHTYTQDGIYTVTLNVTGTDLAGNPAKANETKIDYITVLDTKPLADFYAEPTSGPAPLTVSFYDNSTSYDEIVAWEWDFGDGGTSTEPNPTHTYTEAGTYTVRLTVTDKDGSTASLTRENYITVMEITAPIINIIGPTSDNPVYTQSGKTIQITVKYTEQNPLNLTIRINTIEETFTDIPSGTDVTRTFNLEIPATAPEGKYSLNVTLYNIYNLSSTDTEENAVVIDNTAPTITDVAQLPAENVQPTDDVKVNVTITDNLSPIKNATLLYSTDNGTTWTEIPMTRLTGNIYTATIPKQDYCTHVIYKIEAYDEAANKQVEDNAGQYYAYHVVPEFHIAAILMLMSITTIMAAALRKTKFKNKS